MKRVSPRHGSMGVWPRKRASRSTARVRSWADGKGLLGFPVYKAGMTQVIATDSGKNSMTKGETIAVPATILECPSIKIYSVRAYKQDIYGLNVATDIVVGKDKHLFRRIFSKKTHEDKLKELKPEEFVKFSVTVMTQPSKTGIGKKKPELLEIAVGGKPDEQLAWINEHVGKEISINEVFAEGEYTDAHANTRGRGFQGPVKRFGINLKPSKSEKGRRMPGSLGGWSGQQHFMYRVPMAGQMGYHRRTQFNNMIMKISDKPEEVNPKGGLRHYGVVKTDFMLVKGSLQGAKKRLITLTKATRLYDRSKRSLPTIEKISLESQQKR